MTTIAYRDGVLATDSAVTVDDTYAGSVMKLARLPLGGLIAVCGEVVACYQMILSASDDAHKMPDFDRKAATGLVVDAVGQVWVMDAKGDRAPLGGNYFAMGSGRIAALGAMAAGASAKRAVEIACELDVYSRGPVQVEILNRAREDERNY